MRLPLAVGYGPRDSGGQKDEVSLNAFAESGASGQTFAVKRPGTGIVQFYPPDPESYTNITVPTATAQGIYQLGEDIYFVSDGVLYYCYASNHGYGSAGQAAKCVLSGGPSTGHYFFVQIPDSNHAKSFFLKATTKAFRIYDMSLTEVTDVDYPETTVPGAAYLDGTYYVMTPNGQIYGSELEDPLTWSGLNVIKAGSMPDSGVAIRRMINYVVAFGTYTTEFFYDAGNPVGSPLLPVTNAIALVGCCQADSIADTENTLYFMGVTRQQGRSIYRFNGTVPEKISTPFVDRVISADGLSEVWAYFVKINGHPMYVLTLKDSAVTLVFDTAMNTWHKWNSLVPGTWVVEGGGG